MKHSILWVLILTLSMTAYGQRKERTQTAMEGSIKTISGFSEVVVKYADFSSEYSWLLGGKAGILINDALWIGGAYYTKVDNAVKADFRVGDRSPNLCFEYGGIDFEYIASPDELFHITLQFLIGYGAYSFGDPEDLIEFENKYFYILEPGLNIELNVTKWMRFQWGATFRILLSNEEDLDNLTYRFGRHVHEMSYNSNDLTNIGFQFGIKLGDF